MNTYDSVVVGGSGAVGTMIARLLARDGRSVVTVDPCVGIASEKLVTHRLGDMLEPDEGLRAILREARLVVLAVPESVGERVSFAHFAPGALVVETLSVKSGFAAKVAADAPHLAVVGINPMFAPSLGIEGRPVAAVTHRHGPGVDEFLADIAEWGGRVVEVDADTHDRLAAATQALTHASVLAFGSALATLDVDPALVEAIAPPPARAALALLARITGGEPEVYWDVQSGNPYAGAARAALATAVHQLDDAVGSGSESRFADILSAAEGSIPDGDRYRALCARLFGIVREPASEGDRT